MVWAFGVWLEVGEVGVDHVKEREEFYFYPEKRRETKWRKKKKVSGVTKIKINIIKLIKNK